MPEGNGNGHKATTADIDTELVGKVPITAEVGFTGPRAVGGYIQEEFDPDLRGIRGVRVYDEMRRNDPVIATGLRAIKWVIGRVTWSVEPGGDTPPDKEAAEFLESAMGDMRHPWKSVVASALSMLDFGWAMHEVIWKVRNGPSGDSPSRYDDGRIAWCHIPVISQETLQRWEMDNQGNVYGMQQLVTYGAGSGTHAKQGESVSDWRAHWLRTIPLEKCVNFRFDAERENPEGISLLRPVYRPWYLKKQIEEIEAIGIERDLTGVLIIHLPVGATDTDKTKAIALLEQFKADDMTGFVAPRHGQGPENGWEFEIINSPGSKTIDTDRTIQRYQMEIMRAFLAQFLMLGQGKAGSWALSRDHRGMFELALEAIVDSIQDAANQNLVEPLFRLNDFGKLTAIPRIKAGRVGKADMGVFADMLSKLVEGSLLTPDAELEKFIRTEMELPAKLELETQAPQGKPKAEDTGMGDADTEQASEALAYVLAERGDLPPPDDDEAWQALEDRMAKRLEETERELSEQDDGSNE